ncbi:DUF2975 domain-containing protein [Bacillus mesophilum]|uniref:DUF2975 domain-containing protein n=1 Tax=Bacillus mesophilum TaxID=1071718 RepID=A0A7V7UX40_9BACI|nr:DUF2975 domain-containing protein [Bacillus mesophilum]KAB2331956.1 DUF2975 domain-containing protein [Bacillus mesophilum]
MKQGKILLLKAAVYVMGIVILCLCVFALPTLAHEAAAMNPEFAYLQYPVLIGLYLTAIPFFYALYQALKLLNNLINNLVFSKTAVHSLGMIKHCAGSIIIIYVIGMLFLVMQNALHPGVALIGLAILFLTIVILLFSAVLQDLLKKVMSFKSENELFI